MHYEISPTFYPSDAESALAALEGYLAGGTAVPDVGCTVKACGVLLACGSQFLENPVSPGPALLVLAAKADVQAARKALAAGGLTAINWQAIIKLILTILPFIMPFLNPTPTPTPTPNG